MGIPSFKSALYAMKKQLGQPVVLIGVVSTSYDRQNRSATVSIARVLVKFGIITPIDYHLQNMLSKSNGAFQKYQTYLIVDISEVPTTFDWKRVHYVRYGGTTYNVAKEESIELNKAIFFKLTGAAEDPRFALDAEISQSLTFTDDLEGVKI